METFKQLMAFPLYATVGWLVWVLSVQQGSDGVLAAAVTLIGTGFAAWLLGRGSPGGGMRTASAAVIALLALGVSAISLPLEAASGAGQMASGETAGPKAEPFTAARLAELRAENKPVFVNLTAAWCITCKVNERVALRSDRLAEQFALRGITYLVGDWTNRNAEISALLAEHGRVGVPLYLLYGAAGAKPEILPQILTESMMLDRIAALSSSPQKAAKGDF
jgi:thiol:disulfide interchange protein DsbD